LGEDQHDEEAWPLGNLDLVRNSFLWGRGFALGQGPGLRPLAKSFYL